MAQRLVRPQANIKVSGMPVRVPLAELLPDRDAAASVEEALARVLQGVTAILVVHRPSTLALADRAALLKGGRIVATGTHQELMQRNDLYRALLSQEAEEMAC